ncbi:MAG: hypothetical protein KGN76_16110 [Acidobacteriota bacterium]|nr:hypothetical protein [Acidobacteriota bacterium]
MSRKVWLSLAVVVLLSSAALAGPPSPLDRPVTWIGPEPVVQLPIEDTTVPDLFLLIGRASHVPLGIEPSQHPLPPPPYEDPAAPPTEVRFDDMTVRQAFDTLVKLDPRYGWRDLDGVAVLRPVRAWADPHHFLNRSIGTIKYDRTSPEDMLGRLVAWLYGEPPRRDALGVSQSGDSFPLEVKEGPILMALVATAKADGDMYWRIGYGTGPGRTRLAFTLEFRGLDRRWGIEVGRPHIPPPWNGTTSGAGGRP